MLTFIAQGVKDRTQNISCLGKQQQSIRDEIRQVRSKINGHLDILEKDMIKNVIDIHTTTTADIQAKVNQLTDKSNEMKKLKDNLMAVKEYGSDLQAFFGARRIEDELNKEATYFKSTFDYKYFHLMKITGTIDQKVIDILGLKSFGKVDVETGPSSLQFKASEEKEAQIKSEINSGFQKSINDIKLKLLSSFEIRKGGKINSMSGCAVSAAGKMIFMDGNNQSLVIRNSDNSEKIIRLSNVSRLCDLTVINEQTVVVTTEDGIKIVDVETEQIKKFIKTDQVCYGIAFDRDSLLWCKKCRGIKKMALQDGKISTILPKRFPFFVSDSFVATYSGKMYLTDYLDNRVESCTLDGKLEWEFEDTSILSHPQYTTVDNNMRVYTTSCDSNNVIVISPDGKQGRQLLSKEDGLDKPTGICFDRTKNNLIITNKNGTVFLYHIE